MPSLINKIQNRQLEVALKKSYSSTQQALIKMSADEAQTVNKINFPAEIFRIKFMSYFNVTKDCLMEQCIVFSDEDDGNGGTVSHVIKNYKTYNAEINIRTIFFDDGQFLLRDGSFVMIENSYASFQDNRHFYLTIDVNGINKKPNKWGHDLFTFEIMEDGKFLPMGADGTEYNDDRYYCSLSSSHMLNGIGCTQKALTDKDYWKNLPK